MRSKIAAVLVVFMFMLSGCGVGQAPDPETGPGEPVLDMDGMHWDGDLADLSLDLDMMRRDGVVLVTNAGPGAADDVRIRFGFDEVYPDALPERASYREDRGYIEYELADRLEPGESIEADISGLLHQSWDGLDGNVRLVYALDGQDTRMIVDPNSDLEGDSDG